jgi:hypothetical protein
MPLGMIVQIIAGLGMARMTTLWQMYAVFILSSFANAANTHIPVATVIS